MSQTDYGPVPVSRFKPESTEIFDALATGRRVLVSKHGRVVAVIDPPHAVPQEFLAAYAVPGDRVFAELTASDINQGSPSSAVAEAVGGSPSFVTKDREVYGLLREITDDDLAGQLPTKEQIYERARRTDEFLAENPDAGAEELAFLGEKLNRDLGIGQGGQIREQGTLLGSQVVAHLRSHIEATAHAYAEQTGKIVEQSGAADLPDHSVLVYAIEACTIEAMVSVTEETLWTAASRVMRERINTEVALAVARKRAESALDRFTQGASEQREREETGSSAATAP